MVDMPLKPNQIYDHVADFTKFLELHPTNTTELLTILECASIDFTSKTLASCRIHCIAIIT